MDENNQDPYEFRLSDQEQQVDHVLGQELHPGELCPACVKGRLDYDGMLNLSCEACGFSLAGCFT